MENSIILALIAAATVVGLVAGYLLCGWRVSKRTGQPMLTILRGGGGKAEE